MEFRRSAAAETWERWALLTGFALLVACALGAVVLRQAAVQAQRSVSHTMEVQARAADVLGAMTDAETGQRGFLLTEDPSYLEPYIAATGRIAGLQATLRRLTIDNAEQQKRLDAIDQSIGEKLKILSRSIGLVKSSQRDEAIGLVKDGAGKQIMDAVRAGITQLSAVEAQLLDERQGTLRLLQSASLATTLASFLFSLGLALGVVVRLKRKTKELTKANLALDDQVSIQDEELRIGEAQHQFALAAGGLGEWALDPQSDQSVRSLRHDQIFGYGTPLKHWGFAEFNEHVVPEDRAAIMAGYAATIASEADWRFECRIKRTNDGAIRWIEGVGRHYDSTDGRPRLIGLLADITDRKQHDTMLLESEERFRGTFDNAAVGVAHVSLDGRWLRVNKRLADIVGYSEEELLSQKFQDITHPDDLAADLKQVQQVLSGAIKSYSMDKRYVRKDGSIIWAELTVALQRDAAGAPSYFISVVNDISARKQAEAHQRFLMRELSHRSKNLLAIIQSMAGQTAKSSRSIGEFGERFRQRLQALAASHDLLTDQNWRGAPLKALVARQLVAFTDTDDPRVSIKGPDLTLTAGAAQSIGLALHELATNAVKYGALSVPAGKLAVSWALDAPNGSARRLQLRWVERGGPAVEPPKRKGFGHTVIERLTAAALDGEVNLGFPPEGVIWQLDAPASCLATVDVDAQVAGIP